MDTTPSSSGTSAETDSQAAEQLKTALSAADTNVNQGIQSLGRVHQARLSQATRTVAALTAQYGANDPRVQTAQAAATAIKATVARVSIARQQLAAPAVKAAKTGWALQGYARDEQYNPAAKFTVFLVDAHKTFQPQYGFAYTDDTGYFLLNYAGESGQAAPPASSLQLYLAAVNAEAKPAYLSPTAFQPVKGAASYQDIFVPAGGQSIGDPPPAIRAVALPRKDEKTPPGNAPAASS